MTISPRRRFLVAIKAEKERGTKQAEIVYLSGQKQNASHLIPFQTPRH